MSAVSQSEELRQKAIALLLEEKGAIEEQLSVLGFAASPSATPRQVPATPAKPRICGACGGENHTARTCNKKAPPDVEGAQATLPV